MFYAMAEHLPPQAFAARDRDRGETVETRAARGDRDALTRLLREHGKSIQQLCFFVAGRDDGRDAAQEAFERIVVHVKRFDPERGPFRTWALTVARNVCRDRLRRRGLERAAFTPDGDAATAQAQSHELDPEGSLLVRTAAAGVEAALAELPEGMRSALVMFHFHGASYEEIAESLAIPKGTVMTWLHRGRLRIKDALEASAPRREASL
jgi:RNA polymerase sigma-70 factor (ECF subfamily)